MNLSPTTIIVDAIKDRLEQTEEKYKEIYMTFDLEKGGCDASMIRMDDTREPYPIEEKEISKMKSLFLNKISRAYKSATRDPRKVNKIILVIIMEPEDLLKLFVGVEDSEEIFQLY